MVDFSSNGAGAPSKSHFRFRPAETSTSPANIIGGVVQHQHITPSVQVKILSVVDATGSATISDIVAVLRDHPDPVDAVVGLIGAGILTARLSGALDSNTVVTRRAPDSDPMACEKPMSGSSGGATARSAILPLETTRLHPSVVVGQGAQRRALGKLDALRRPGVYLLINPTSAYVGVGSVVGARISAGQQPIDEVETIVAITDADDRLTVDDAQAVERSIWSRLAASAERHLINKVPDGASISPERFLQLELFSATACVAMRQAGVLFTGQSPRAVISGPISEPGRLGRPRVFDEIPPGEILELSHSDGLISLAARQHDGRWLLLRGSDVRTDVAKTANCSVSYLRAAWAFSGLLKPSADGRSLTVARDIVFSSGSAVAQFCSGSKGRALSAWAPIDPDGGFDPLTPQLIAQ